MKHRNLPYFSSCSTWLAAWPSVAAESDPSTAEVVTGLSNTVPAFIFIAVAVAMLLTLIIRASAAHVSSVMRENAGRRRIAKVLREKSKDVLDDFILPGAYGGLTRIDHAILTSGGVLCIQTKHYNGVIFGGAEEPQWTNVDGPGRRRFLNPLIQNEGRTRALQKVIPNVPVANLVVFTGKVQFTTPQEKNVVPVADLSSYIAKFVFGPCKIDDWDAAWLTIKAAALTDEDSRKDFGAQLSFS